MVSALTVRKLMYILEMKMSNTSWKKFKLGDIGEFSKGAGISKVELVNRPERSGIW